MTEYTTETYQQRKDIETTKRLQVYVGVLSAIIMFGSIILHQTSIIWEWI